MKHLLFSHFEDTLNIDKKNMTYCLMVSYRFGSIWAYIETEDLVQMNNWCHFIVDSAIYILNNYTLYLTDHAALKIFGFKKVFEYLVAKLLKLNYIEKVLPS